MNATATNGDTWVGERNGSWWLYEDRNGNQYESKEVPAYRIRMDNATQQADERGQLSICPILTAAQS